MAEAYTGAKSASARNGRLPGERCCGEAAGVGRQRSME